MPNFEELSELVLGYIIESKTRSEYAINKFKRKYDFKPDIVNGKIKDPNNGTIYVDDDRRIRVKLNDRNGNYSSLTSTYNDMNLGKNFFKLKNSNTMPKKHFNLFC